LTFRDFKLAEKSSEATKI
jgi:hypothetical protein